MAVVAEENEANELSHKQVLEILSGLLLGMFLAALDQTIVSTAIRTIGDELHGLSLQAWVTTAYLITSTISTPIYGKLGDLYGRKKLFLFAITVFVLGSCACSFATSMGMLAAFRALQGIGAGGLFSLALAIIGDIVPPRERAKYTGYFMAVFGTSSVLGPVIGGFFAESSSILGVTGWRWVFLINVPIGVLALGVVAKTLHLHHHRLPARIDWWGASAIVLALVPLLTVAEQGREWGWSSPRALACYVVGGAGALLFLLVEAKMGDSALIPLRLFKNKTVGVTILASVILGVGMFGGMMILPLYMQIVHNTSPMKSGLMMLPMVLGMMLTASCSGLITAKTGRVREFPIVGTAVAALALFLLSTIGADTPLWRVMGFMFVLGFGLGCCMQPLTVIIQNAVPPTEIGVASSSATFFRQMGGTLGVAVFISMLFSSLQENIKNAFTDALPSIKQAVASDPSLMKNPLNQALLSGDSSVLAGVQNDSSLIGKLSPVLSHPLKVGFSESMTPIFFTAGCIMALAFLITLLMPRVELREASASALRRQEASASQE